MTHHPQWLYKEAPPLKIKTRHGVKEASWKNHPTYTVENLNPNSRAVKTIEMTVKRAIILSQICADHLHHQGHDQAATTPPERWYLKDADLTDMWGRHWRQHPEYRAWPIVYQQWLGGSLRRSIDDTMRQLPEISRAKIEETVRKRYRLEPDDQE